MSIFKKLLLSDHTYQRRLNRFNFFQVCADVVVHSSHASFVVFSASLTKSSFINGSFSKPCTTWSSIAFETCSTPILGTPIVHLRPVASRYFAILPGSVISPGLATEASMSPLRSVAKARTSFSVWPCYNIRGELEQKFGRLTLIFVYSGLKDGVLVWSRSAATPLMYLATLRIAWQ